MCLESYTLLKFEKCIKLYNLTVQCHYTIKSCGHGLIIFKDLYQIQNREISIITSQCTITSNLHLKTY